MSLFVVIYNLNSIIYLISKKKSFQKKSDKKFSHFLDRLILDKKNAFFMFCVNKLFYTTILISIYYNHFLKHPFLTPYTLENNLAKVGKIVSRQKQIGQKLWSVQKKVGKTFSHSAKIWSLFTDLFFYR